MCLSGYAQNQRLLRDVVYAQRVYLLRQLHSVLLLLRRYARLTASRTTLVSPYQKGKTSLDLNEARDDGVLGWQWYQLDHMQTTCTSLQTDNHINTSSLNVYRPNALLQQCQSTEGKHLTT